MKRFAQKVKNLNNKSGPFLFFLRLPLRMLDTFKRIISTAFWRLFVAKMGKGSIVEWGVSFEIPKNVILGQNVYIGKNSLFGSENISGKLEIKDNVQIGKNCSIDHTGNVTLNEWVLLSADVSIYSHNHGYDPRGPSKSTNIEIGENTWIGRKTIILDSVQFIAKNSVIAAGSVVSKPCVNPMSIYGGVPARLIGATERK